MQNLLTQQERAYYQYLFDQIDTKKEGKVGGREAVMFFKKSGLPVENLKKIWQISAKTTNEYLKQDEFFMALRLISYEQNGIVGEEKNIVQNIQVSLPKFEGFQTPQISQVEQPGLWKISPIEMQNFLLIFEQFDKNKSGTLSDQEMQKIIKSTQLNSEICAQIWDIVNPNYEETFSKSQFLMCMLLLSKAKSGITIPKEMPLELQYSSGFIQKPSQNEFIQQSVSQSNQNSLSQSNQQQFITNQNQDEVYPKLQATLDFLNMQRLKNLQFLENLKKQNEIIVQSNNQLDSIFKDIKNKLQKQPISQTNIIQKSQPSFKIEAKPTEVIDSVRLNQQTSYNNYDADSYFQNNNLYPQLSQIVAPLDYSSINPQNYEYDNNYKEKNNYDYSQNTYSSSDNIGLDQYLAQQKQIQNGMSLPSYRNGSQSNKINGQAVEIEDELEKYLKNKKAEEPKSNQKNEFYDENFLADQFDPKNQNVGDFDF